MTQRSDELARVIDASALTPAEERALRSAIADGDQLVYFIQAADGGPVKIGHSARPEERLRDHQVSNAAPLIIRKLLPGGPRVERELHEQFSSARLSGEWFRPVDELCRMSGARRIESPLIEQARADGFKLGYAAARADTGHLPPALTARDVAHLLGVSAETILRWTRRSELPAFRLPGGALRYLREDIDEWIAERKGAATS